MSDTGNPAALAGITTVESTRSLIAVNAITIVLAIAFKWPFATLAFPYWVQSIVIGYFSRRRILELRQFSTEGFKINGQVPPATFETQRSTANFFALHYGFFHAAYLVFLWKFLHELDLWDWLSVGAATVMFIWNHAESYRRNAEADRTGTPNIGFLMFLPYLRILPMHLTILCGVALGGGVPAILIFGSLKTVADYAMHKIEHRMLRKAGQVSP